MRYVRSWMCSGGSVPYRDPPCSGRPRSPLFRATATSPASPDPTASRGAPADDPAGPREHAVAPMPQCPAGCDGASAWMAPSGQLLRTAIKDRAIILVAINEFDRTVGLHRESDVAQDGPGGKLALKLRINAFTVVLSMEESADADLGMDLVGGDFHLKLGGVAAITFARDVLRVTSGERKIVSRRGRTNACGQSKTDAAYKWMDSSHY